MEIEAKEIQVKAILTLNQKELEMLNYLSSFLPSKIVVEKIGSKYNGRDWNDLFRSMLECTGKIMGEITDAKQSLFKDIRK